MDTRAKCLVNARKKIKALEREQDKIFGQTLRALKIRQIDHESDIVWDYLFNGVGTAIEVLRRVAR
jgi:hypothetical protein